jgi:uncharacterized protein YjiS (DUF1127 family)
MQQCFSGMPGRVGAGHGAGSQPVLRADQIWSASGTLLRCNIVTGNQVNRSHLLTNSLEGGLLERMWTMSDFADHTPTLLARSPGHRPVFAPALKTLWGWLSAPVRGYFERELVVRELTSLSDRDLADMGLSRSDLPAVVRGLYGRDRLNARKLDPDSVSY